MASLKRQTQLLEVSMLFSKAMNTVDCFNENGVKTSVAIIPPSSVLKNHVNDYADFAMALISKYTGKNFQVKFAEELISCRHINPTKEDKTKYFEYILQIQKRIFGDDFETENFARILNNDCILDNCMFG